MKSRRDVQNEPFKPHALKVAEAARARVMGGGEEDDLTDAEGRRLAEIHQWKNHVVDLHRVLSVSQAMFLMLEHNNEALLRVAIEIITCPEAQKVLWWDERWYYNDEDREWFRKQVRQKLAQLLNGMQIKMPAEEEKDEDDPMYEELNNKIQTAEKARAAAEKGQQAAEHRLREAEEALRESTGHGKELEKSMEKLRKELKEAMAAAENRPVAPDGKEELEKANQQIRLIEEQKKKAEEKLAKVEEELKKSAPKSELEKAEEAKAKLTAQYSEAQGKCKELESECRMLKSRLEMELNKPKDNKPAPVKAQAAAKGPQVVEVEKVVEKVIVDDSAKAALADLQKTLAQEQHRAEEFQKESERSKAQVSELEDKNSGLNRQIRKLEDDILELKSKLAHALNKPPPPAPTPAPVKEEEAPKPVKPKPEPEPPKPPPVERPREESPPPVAAPRSPRQRPPAGVPQEEYDRVVQNLQKSKERNSRLVEENNELKQANEAYESKNAKLLKMLHQIKEQLKRVTEIAEKKGYGNLVQSILEEANVSQTLESPEYTAFDRLYDDAKRRQERQRIILETKQGLRPKSDLEEFDHPNRRASRAGMVNMADALSAQKHARAARRRAGRMRQGGRQGGGGQGTSTGASQADGSSGNEDMDDDEDFDDGPLLCERCGRDLEGGGGFDASSVSSWAPSSAVAGNFMAAGTGNFFNPGAGNQPNVIPGNHNPMWKIRQSLDAASFAQAAGAFGQAFPDTTDGQLFHPPAAAAAFQKSPGAAMRPAIGSRSRPASDAGSMRSQSTGARVKQQRAGSPQAPGQMFAAADFFQIHGQPMRDDSRERSVRSSGGQQAAGQFYGAEPFQVQGYSSSERSGGVADARPSSSMGRPSSPIGISSISRQRSPGRPLVRSSSPPQQTAPIRSPSPVGHVEAALSHSAQAGQMTHARSSSQIYSAVGQRASIGSSSSGRHTPAGRSPSPLGEVDAMTVISYAGEAAPMRSPSPLQRSDTMSSSPAGQTAPVRLSNPAGSTASTRSSNQEGKIRRPHSQPNLRRGGPTGDDDGISKTRSLGMMKPGLAIQGNSKEQGDRRGDSRREFHRQMPDVILSPWHLPSPDKRSARQLSNSQEIVSGRGSQGLQSSQSSPSLTGGGPSTAMALDLQIQNGGNPTAAHEPRRLMRQAKSTGGLSAGEVADDLQLGDGIKAGQAKAGPPRFRGNKISGKVNSMFHSMVSAVGSKKQIWKSGDVERQMWPKDEKQMWSGKSGDMAPNLLSLGQKTYIYAGGVRPIPTTELTPGWGTGWDSVPGKEASDFPPAKEL